MSSPFMTHYPGCYGFGDYMTRLRQPQRCHTGSPRLIKSLNANPPMLQEDVTSKRSRLTKVNSRRHPSKTSARPPSRSLPPQCNNTPTMHLRSALSKPYVTGMVPFSESGAFGSENAYTSVLCELGTPAKGLAGVVVLLLTMFRSGYPIPDPDTLQKIAHCMLFDTNIEERWWPYAVSQAAYVQNRLAGTTRGGKTPYEIFYAKVPSLHHICCFGCAVYVVLCGNTRTTRLRDNPIVSKHLCPQALHGTYLGYSNVTRTIKGHRAWLPAVNQIIIVKGICFSELEHQDEGAHPSHMPVLSSDSQLLQSYHWLSISDTSPDSGNEDDSPPSLPPFS
ncbi:uncharacterized protein UDID_19309 [Ustilago sp. UG-2017a]|nr:uncharacterized protein UDID_19309 [Ustilago sp. UG-2017a]